MLSDGRKKAGRPFDEHSYERAIVADKRGNARRLETVIGAMKMENEDLKRTEYPSPYIKGLIQENVKDMMVMTRIASKLRAEAEIINNKIKTEKAKKVKPNGDGSVYNFTSSYADVTIDLAEALDTETRQRLAINNLFDMPIPTESADELWDGMAEQRDELD